MHGEVRSSTLLKQQHNSEEQTADKSSKISALFTSLCGDFSGRSCSKTMLVKVHINPDQQVFVYAMHDDQSNRTLASPALLDELGVTGPVQRYTLNSCGGSTVINARIVPEMYIRSADGTTELTLNNVVKCDIPIDRSEIPTPEITHHYPHLNGLTSCIPPLDE